MPPTHDIDSFDAISGSERSLQMTAQEPEDDIKYIFLMLEEVGDVQGRLVLKASDVN